MKRALLNVDDVLMQAPKAAKWVKRDLSNLTQSKLERIAMLEKKILALEHENEERIRSLSTSPSNQHLSLSTPDHLQSLDSCLDLDCRMPAEDVIETAQKICRNARYLLRQDLANKNRTIEELETKLAMLKSRNEILRQTEKFCLVGREDAVVYVPMTAAKSFSEVLRGCYEFQDATSSAPASFKLEMLDECTLPLLARAMVEGSQCNAFAGCEAAWLFRLMQACDLLLAQEAFEALHRELTGAHRNLPDFLSIDDAFALLRFATASPFAHKWSSLSVEALGVVARHAEQVEPRGLQHLSHAQQLQLITIPHIHPAHPPWDAALQLPGLPISSSEAACRSESESDADLVEGCEGALDLQIVAERRGAVALDESALATFVQVELTCTASAAHSGSASAWAGGCWTRSAHVVGRACGAGLVRLALEGLVPAHDAPRLRAAQSVRVRWRLTAGREGAAWEQDLQRRCALGLACLELPLHRAVALAADPLAAGLACEPALQQLLLEWSIAHWRAFDLEERPQLLCWLPEQVEPAVGRLDGAFCAATAADGRLLSCLLAWASHADRTGGEAGSRVLDRILESKEVGQERAAWDAQLTAEEQAQVLRSPGFRRLVSSAVRDKFHRLPFDFLPPPFSCPLRDPDWFAGLLPPIKLPD